MMLDHGKNHWDRRCYTAPAGLALEALTVADCLGDKSELLQGALKQALAHRTLLQHLQSAQPSASEAQLLGAKYSAVAPQEPPWRQPAVKEIAAYKVTSSCYGIHREGKMFFCDCLMHIAFTTLALFGRSSDRQTQSTRVEMRSLILLNVCPIAVRATSAVIVFRNMLQKLCHAGIL